jgi:hypothetical protein
VSDTFDPYRDWLHIAGGKAGANYYRLLGLKTYESDPLRIQAAADKQIARVEQIAPGTHALQRLQLLDELRAARICLLNPAARARYDAALRGNSQVDKPQTGKSPGPDAPAIAIPLAAPAPTPEIPPWGEEEIPKTLLSSTQGGGRPSALSTIFGLAAAAGAVALVGAAWWQFQAADELAAQEGRPGGAAQAREFVPMPQVARHAPAKIAPVSSALADDAAPPATESAAIAESVATDSPPPGAPSSDSTGDVRPRGVLAAGPKRAGDDAAGSFSRSVNRARGALARRELELARKHLDRARELATADEHHVQLRQLDALHAELVRFVEAVEAGIPKFNASDELTVGDRVMIVVESGPGRLTVRDEGQRREFTAADMPAELALHVAKAGIDENSAAARRAFGAFHAAVAEGDRELARELWQQAAAEGQEMALLEPLLEPEALAIAREAVPSSEALAAAQERVSGEFAEAIKTHKSREQKSELAARLIAAAAEADDPADQYALLSEACSWSASAADPRRALVAVDQLATWFTVDADALRAATLAKAAAAAPLGEVSAEIARTALVQLNRNEESDNDASKEVQRSLAGTAVQAARKSRDQALLEQAIQQRREVGRPRK